MLGFGGKPQQAPPGGMGVPTQRVLALSSQGFSEPDIIRTLRQEGYGPAEVDAAVKNAMRSGAGQPQAPPPTAPRPGYPQQPAPFPRPAPPARQAPQPFGGFEQPTFGKSKYASPTDWSEEEDDLPDDDLDMEDVPKDRRIGPGAMFSELDEEKLPPPPGARDVQPLRFAEAPLPKERDERDKEIKDRRRREVEELVEQIAEEKWQDMARRVRDIEDRTEKLSSDIKSAPAHGAGGASSEELSVLKNDLANVKETIEETNARIDSLEEVVKGSLSPMIESLRKLRGGAPAAADRPEHISSLPPSRPPAKESPEPEPSYEIPRYAPKKEYSG